MREVENAQTIDFNCDLGEFTSPEGAADESAIFQWISSCNIACGFHAGDVLSMELSMHRAIKHGVAIGAHPSFPDREGFGRRHMDLSNDALRICLYDQIAAARNMAKTLHTHVAHVKPHGALYHHIAADPIAARILLDVIEDFDPRMSVYGPFDSALHHLCLKSGQSFKVEAFADRRYCDDLTLMPRSEANSLLPTSEAVAQAVELVIRKRVRTASGQWQHLQADTLCIHSDHQGAAFLAERIHHELTQHGILIASH